MNNKIELLAPAGNEESFKAAVNAGADAVYMGIDRYNARTMSKNFTVEEYLNAIFEAHKRGAKVYLTLNKFSKLDDYLDIIKEFNNKKGILYLDSGEYFEVKE
mgnify:CR=1 FL=1